MTGLAQTRNRNLEFKICKLKRKLTVNEKKNGEDLTTQRFFFTEGPIPGIQRIFFAVILLSPILRSSLSAVLYLSYHAHCHSFPSDFGKCEKGMSLLLPKDTLYLTTLVYLAGDPVDTRSLASHDLSQGVPSFPERKDQVL